MAIPEVTSGTVAVLHIVAAACTIYLLYTQDASSLTLTLRLQFSGWKNVLDLYRNGTYPNITAPALADVLSTAWCAFPLAPNASYAPACQCIAQQHALFLNTSRESIVSSCLRYRPSWRVWPVWTVYPATSATYVFLLTACFACAATKNRYAEYASWALTVAGMVGMCVRDPLIHFPWLAAFGTAFLVIFLVLRPGLQTTFSDHPYRSCFWWTEFFVGPVFASYMLLFNNGRDLVLLAAVVGLGWVMASFALRSMWYDVVFAEHPRLMLFLRWAAWGGIVVITAAMAFLASYYRRWDSVYYMSSGSVGLYAVTAGIALLQFPGFSMWGSFSIQILLAIARNAVLLALIWRDLRL